MSEDMPARWVSIDPGDKHVGIARWEGTTCLNTTEYDPRGALLMVEHLLVSREVDHVVYEKFALDPRRAAEQSGSEFLTSQMIGVLKWMCEVKHGTPITGFMNHEHKRIYKMGWYRELSLKDKRKLAWWGRGSGEHCKDAWCVGMWFKHTRGHGQYGIE